MTSSDGQQYVTVEMFNEGIAELKAEIRTVERNVAVNAVKIDGIKSYLCVGFIFVAIIVVGLALALNLLYMFRDMYHNSERSSQHERDIHSLKEEIARLKAGQ